MPSVNDEIVRRIKLHLNEHYDPEFDYCLEPWASPDSDDYKSLGWDAGTNNHQEIIMGIIKEVEEESAIDKD